MRSVILYRYYLDWRAKLLAGFFTVVATFALAYAWLFTHLLNAAFAVPVALAFVCWFFWGLDRRNRDQYHYCIRIGAQLEGETHGVYTLLKESWENPDALRRPSHSSLLTLLFVTTAVLSLIIAAATLAMVLMP